MSEYVLYGGGISRSAGLEAVLRELGLPHRVEPVDITHGEHRSEAFRAISPVGFVPVLQTPDGAVLHETSGLMLYLADLHPAARLAPPPDGPARGLFMTRYFYLVNEIEGPTKPAFYTRRIAPRDEDVSGIRDRMVDTLFKRWALYDRWLADGGPWALGEEFSVADILMALWATYGLVEPDDIVSRFPAVKRCYDAVLAREGAGPPIRTAHERMLGIRAVLPS